MKRLKLNSTEEESPYFSSFKGTDMDGEAAGVVFQAQILTNPLLTDKIVSQLSYLDLLSCSLVSKAWNLVSRSKLVAEHESYLEISEETSAEVLQEFECLISGDHGQELPFNGIAITLDDSVKSWPFAQAPFPHLLWSITRKLSLKHLKIDIGYLSLAPAELAYIFRTFVVPHLRTLERISIEICPLLADCRLELQQLKVESLPMLKYFRIDVPVQAETFQRILRACPRLKELDWFITPAQLLSLRKTNKLHLVDMVSFDLIELTSKDIQVLSYYGKLIRRLGIGLKRRSKLKLFQTDIITSRLKPMFTRFQDNLESLVIDLEPLLVILSGNNNLLPLRKLKELKVFGSSTWCPSVFKHINFPTLFPNLETMAFFWDVEDSKWFRREVVDEEYPLHVEQAPAALVSVTKLHVEVPEGVRGVGQELVLKTIELDRVFSSLTSLTLTFTEHVYRIFQFVDLFQWICESWGDTLEVLILKGIKCFRLGGPRRNFDSGLSRHERNGLREVMRRPLPNGVNYSDKLKCLGRVAMDFYHCTMIKDQWEKRYAYFGVEKTLVKPGQGQECQLTVRGCGAKERLKRVKNGVSLYDTLLGLHLCPEDEDSPFEQILASSSVCASLCKMLPTKDLLSVSRVSKSWNLAAREVLSEDRVCTLTVQPLSLRFEETKAKFRWLKTSEQKLFNVLRVVAPYPRVVDFLFFYGLIFQDLKVPFGKQATTAFKALQIVCSTEEELRAGLPQSDTYTEIKLLQFLPKFLSKLSLNLIQHLDTSLYNFDQIFRTNAGQLLVPNLRSIKILDHWRLQEYSETFERLLRDLKDLEEIRSPFSSKLLPLVDSLEKANCVKHVQIYEQHHPGEELDLPKERSDQDSRSEMEGLLNFAEVYQPALESITIPSGSYSMMTKPILTKALSLLITSSFESLHNLCVDLVTLSLISSTYTKPMGSVQSISLTYDPGDFDRFLLLQNLPFSDMLPIIQEVTFIPQFSAVGHHHDEDEELFRLSSLNPKPCSTVRSITFRGNVEQLLFEKKSRTLEPLILGYIGNAFPGVENCFYYGPSLTLNWEDFEVLSSSVWTAFQSIKTLRLVSPVTDPESLGVSIFGISEEEFRRWDELIPNGFLENKFNSINYASTIDYAVVHCKNFRSFTLLPDKRNIQSYESSIEFGIEEQD